MKRCWLIRLNQPLDENDSTPISLIYLDISDECITDIPIFEFRMMNESLKPIESFIIELSNVTDGYESGFVLRAVSTHSDGTAEVFAKSDYIPIKSLVSGSQRFYDYGIDIIVKEFKEFIRSKIFPIILVGSNDCLVELRIEDINRHDRDNDKLEAQFRKVMMRYKTNQSQ